jgi:hypothetical protein
MRLARTAVTILALGLAVPGAPWASASSTDPIDLDTLIPPPPDGADCRLDGNRIICHTSVIEPQRIHEPLFDLPCGTIYETSTDVRRGIRWYDASSRSIVKRIVFFDLEGTWSLDPGGAEPRATVTVNAVSRDTAFPDPYDQDSWPTRFYGVGFTVRAQAYGVIAHVTHAQGYGPDEDGHGVEDAVEDPTVLKEVCEALGA